MNMLKKLAMLAVVAGGLVFAATAGEAEAGHRHGFKGGFHGKFHHGGFGHKFHHHNKFHHHHHHKFHHHHYPTYHAPTIQYYWCDIHDCYYYFDTYGVKHYVH